MGDITTFDEDVDLSSVPMIPTNRFCNLLQIRYKIKVEVEIENLKKFTVKIPVTIGAHAIEDADLTDGGKSSF